MFILKAYIFFGWDKVGNDSQGNTFFVKKDKRKVLYSGIAEPSKIDTQWHMWLHGWDCFPNHNIKPMCWEKDRRPNYTGTACAYDPKKNTILKKNYSNNGMERVYETWNPV